MRASLEQEYTAPPAPRCLNRNAFLPDELSYQDIWQQPSLLMVAYARGLQYWAEKLNPLESPDLCPLAGSVVELRETVWEHVTFTNWDVLWGLGAVHLGATSWWPQNTLFSQVLSLLVEGQDFMEAMTHTTLPIADEDVARCTTPPSGTGKENWYLLVITASVEQLSLGPSSNNPEGPTNDSSSGSTFQNPWMAVIFFGSIKVVSYGGITVKELKE